MNTFEILLVSGSWAGALSALRPSIRSRRSLLPTGMVFWAIGCTLFSSFVYGWIDPLLGGINLTNLIWRSCVIVGIGYLAAMVLRATRNEAHSPRAERGIAAATGIALALQAGIFFANRWTTIDPYLTSYGGTVGREMFFNVMAVWMALFAVYLLLVLRRAWSGHSVRSTRWGLGLIGLSVVFDLLYTADVVGAGLVRMTVDPTFLLGDGLDPIVVVALVGGALIGGLGVMVACFPTVIDNLWMRWLLFRLIPTWKRASEHVEDLTLGTSTKRRTVPFLLGVESVLCRRWVEVLDCERSAGFTPTPREQALLAAIAEQLPSFTGGGRPSPVGGLSSLLSVSSRA